MQGSTNLDELEQHWKDFLSHLERFWYKSQAHFGRSPKWKSWASSWQRERERDPLLNYLRLARGAHEHTLEEISARKSGSLTITAGPTGGGLLHGFEIANGVLTADVGAGSIQFTFSPDRVVTLPIRSRGEDCPPPTTHLGESVNPENVVEMASAGYKYYERFLTEAEAHLVNTNGV